MQCLTWAFSKPHGSQQEPFSSAAFQSRSWLQQLPMCLAPCATVNKELMATGATPLEMMGKGGQWDRRQQS